MKKVTKKINKKNKSDNQVIKQSHYDYTHNKSPYAVELLNITKTFNKGSLIANDNVTIRVRKNAIHSIVGENGAGKSTLMSILFGSMKLDKGQVNVNGKKIHFRSASDATYAGIGMVFQHFKLINSHTILDNIIIGSEITRHGILDRDSSRVKINDIIKRYKLNVDLKKRIINCTVSEQQKVEILKLLYRDVDILIFDEPTAVLSDEEIKGFLKMLKEFKRIGKTIIFITHKLNEVTEVADYVTVIRQGKVVKEVKASTINERELADAMVGKKLVLSKNNSKDTSFDKRRVVCEVKDLCAGRIFNPKIKALNNLNLKIYENEILGLVGIENNGQTELALILGGIFKNKNIKGTVKIYDYANNKYIDVLKSNVRQINDAGVSHVPGDRLKYGIIGEETVAINSVINQLHKAPYNNFGFLNKNEINNQAVKIINNWDVRGANNGQSLASQLSGGNLQKLVIGRELTKPHNFVILVQPNRGLDLGAVNNIHKKIIQDIKQNNSTVLLISYELDEILSICSRIAIIDEGKIVYSAPRIKTNRETIAKYLSRSNMKGGK